jgi:hypothetical protein
MKMKMWVVGIARCELGIRHMNALVTLAFGHLGMKHTFPLNRDGLSTEPTARLQIETQFVLLKSLTALDHDGPANPIAK